ATELWNGNRERIGSMFDADHPIRWAFRTHGERRREYEALLDARWARLRSHREARLWLEALALAGPTRWPHPLMTWPRDRPASALHWAARRTRPPARSSRGRRRLHRPGRGVAPPDRSHSSARP